MKERTYRPIWRASSRGISSLIFSNSSYSRLDQFGLGRYAAIVTDHELATYRDALFEGYAPPFLLCDCSVLNALVQLGEGRVGANDERLLIVGDERRLRSRIGVRLDDRSCGIQRHRSSGEWDRFCGRGRRSLRSGRDARSLSLGIQVRHVRVPVAVGRSRLPHTL